MVLRSYARFLLEVNNNPVKATKLLEEADTIEVSRGTDAEARTN